MSRQENNIYGIFSIKRRTPNKRWVYRAEFKINVTGVYSRSRRLFETSILNQDYWLKLRISSLSTILFEFYPLIIKPKLPFTIVLLTIKTEKKTTHQVSCQFLLIVVTFLRACHPSQDHLEVSPAFFQEFLELFHNFASTPPCSQSLAKYVCCRALSIHFFLISQRKIKRRALITFLSVTVFANDLAK